MSSAPSCACSTYTSATVECPWVPVGLKLMPTVCCADVASICPPKVKVHLAESGFMPQFRDAAKKKLHKCPAAKSASLPPPLVVANQSPVAKPI